MRLAPYIKDYTGINRIYKKLNPTGKWKIETGPFYVNKIFIEHKSCWIFKYWIDEDDIIFLPEENSKIFKCK